MQLLILVIFAYLILQITSKTTTTGTPLLSAANNTATANPGGYVATTPNNFVLASSASGLVYNSLTGTMVNKNGGSISGNNGGVSSSTASTGVSQSTEYPSSAFYPGTNELIQYGADGTALSYADAYGGSYTQNTDTSTGSTGVLLSDANNSNTNNNNLGNWTGI
jgi:hypothetical protein